MTKMRVHSDAAGSGLDSTELGLIDIDAFDAEDGGIDDGLHTLFPPPDGYVGRAEQARQQWQ